MLSVSEIKASLLMAIANKTLLNLRGEDYLFISDSIFLRVSTEVTTGELLFCITDSNKQLRSYFCLSDIPLRDSGVRANGAYLPS